MNVLKLGFGVLDLSISGIKSLAHTPLNEYNEINLNMQRIENIIQDPKHELSLRALECGSPGMCLMFLSM
jgi:hypothetical protein